MQTLARGEREKLLYMESELKKRVVGQDKVGFFFFAGCFVLVWGVIANVYSWG